MKNYGHEDTLLDIARRFDIGQDEIVLANTQVDRWLPGEGEAQGGLNDLPGTNS